MIKRVKKFWLSDVSFVSQLLFILFVTFILPMLIEYGYYNFTLIKGMFLLLFLSGLFFEYKNGLIWLAIALLSLQTYLFVSDFFDDENTNFLMNWVTIANVLLFMYINLRLLFRDDCMNFYRVIGAINVYLLIAVYGALFMGYIHYLTGTSLMGDDLVLTNTEADYSHFMYFSLSSLTTVGFGDVYAANMAVKMLAVFLSSVGMLYPAIVIARLVSANTLARKNS